MKSLKKTIKFLEHLVTLYGELRFTFTETGGGLALEWVTDIEKLDSLEKLEDILYDIDMKLETVYELKTTNHREYIIQLNKEGLIAKINYEWNHSDMREYNLDGDVDLIKLISAEINTRLSKKIGVTVIEFTENYDYNIVFSTDDTLDKSVFLLSDLKNHKNAKIPFSTWVRLKKAIIALSEKNGANTSEKYCQFDYNLTSGSDLEIIERWSDMFVFEEIIDDMGSF